jgi:hypothetical protein
MIGRHTPAHQFDDTREKCDLEVVAWLELYFWVDRIGTPLGLMIRPI